MKNKPVLILGSGGHASVLLDILIRQEYDVIGFVSPDKKINRKIFNDYQQFYNDEDVFKYNSKEIELVNGVGSLPNNSIRRKLYDKFRCEQYTFATVIADSAEISQQSCIKEGAQILHRAVIQTGVEIGENTIINSGSVIEHDSNIGKNNHIAPSSTICGGVKIGNNVHIGAGAVIIQSINIGDKSIIGAGCIITRNIDEKNIVYPPRNFQKVL